MSINHIRAQGVEIIFSVMRPDDFLQAVLGDTGAKALIDATRREPSLAPIIGPRVALAWVSTLSKFDGVIPGTTHKLRLQKNSGFSGIAVVGDTEIPFSHASPEHIAAIVAFSLGVQPSKLPKTKSIVRLGKTIDFLAQRNLSKGALNPSLGYSLHEEKLPDGIRIHAKDSNGNHVGTAWFIHHEGALKPVTVGVDDDHQRRGLATAMYDHAKKITGKNILPGDLQTPEGQAFRGTYKTELPGQTAKPREAQGPIGPVQPTRQSKGSSKLPRQPKLPALKVEKHEMTARCSVCGQNFFNDGKYCGCRCNNVIAKSIHTTYFCDGVVLEFNAPLSMTHFNAIKKAIKNV